METHLEEKFKRAAEVICKQGTVPFPVSDTAVARNIWKQLTHHQLKVFWSDATLKNEAGESWFNKVEESPEKSQHMVVLVTENSLKSEWVLLEYRAFLNSCYKEF